LLLEKYLLLMLDIFFQLLVDFLVCFLLRITNIKSTVSWLYLYSVLSLLLWGRRILSLSLLILLSLNLGIKLLNILTCCHICKVSLICSRSLTSPISFVCDIGCICLIGNFWLSITLTYLWHSWRRVHTWFDLLGEDHWSCRVGIQHIQSVVWNEHFLIIVVF
jgi:hypothetical protein